MPDPRVQALAGALCTSLLAVTGITNKSLRALMTGLLGEDYNMTRASYDLTRLRRNGLIDRVDGHNLYQLPLMAAPDPPTPPPLRAALRTIDQHINARFADARLPAAAA